MRVRLGTLQSSPVAGYWLLELTYEHSECEFVRGYNKILETLVGKAGSNLTEPGQGLSEVKERTAKGFVSYVHFVLITRSHLVLIARSY
jgi:hypothetical protein